MADEMGDMKGEWKVAWKVETSVESLGVSTVLPMAAEKAERSAASMEFARAVVRVDLLDFEKDGWSVDELAG